MDIEVIQVFKEERRVTAEIRFERWHLWIAWVARGREQNPFVGDAFYFPPPDPFFPEHEVGRIVSLVRIDVQTRLDKQTN
jgi:hypothetical protein